MIYRMLICVKDTLLAIFCLSSVDTLSCTVMSRNHNDKFCIFYWLTGNRFPDRIVAFPFTSVRNICEQNCPPCCRLWAQQLILVRIIYFQLLTLIRIQCVTPNIGNATMFYQSLFPIDGSYIPNSKQSIILGLHSLNGNMSYRQSSWNLEAARLDVIMIVSFWNFSGNWVVLLLGYTLEVQILYTFFNLCFTFLRLYIWGDHVMVFCQFIHVNLGKAIFLATHHHHHHHCYHHTCHHNHPWHHIIIY